MDKLKFETKSGTERNIEQIAELFPEVITESRDKDGKLVKTVKWDTLRALLGDSIAEGAEAYDFTWVGKRKALIEAGTPIRKTLRPVKADSVNWDTTQNLYIEGDNLDILKLLTDSYLGKIKMIYIDPPYNTGSDFIYRDDFTMDKDEYDDGTERVDEDGNVNFKENLTTNPRFHSDWCSMIYPRLKVARNLLTDDGVIFISIDDNEVHNLRKICDEVFGAQNFIAEFPRVTKKGGKSSTAIAKNHDYILVYSKNFDAVKFYPPTHTDEGFNNKDEYFTDRGYYKLNQTLDYDTLGYVYTLDYPIEINGETFYAGGVSESEYRNRKDTRPNFGSRWRWSKELFDFGFAQGFVEVKGKRIYTKTYQGASIEKVGGNYSVVEIERTKPLSTLEFTDNNYSNDNAKKAVDYIFQKGIFDYTKPPELLRYLCNITTRNSDIILDFFSGSATTAHAVMQLNAEDGGNRKFIMVQLAEATDEKSEAYKAGYKNICEIGKERIRRAGRKINEELGSRNEQLNFSSLTPNSSLLTPNFPHAPNLDIGFRVFKLDESNFKDVHFSAGQLAEMSLFDTLAENLKDDRTAEDLLYSCILEWGLSLTLPHTEETIDGKKVFVVNGGDLIACFEKDLPESVIKAIANRKPLNALFRESCFKDSPAKINNEEIFKLISPSTKVKVL